MFQADGGVPAWIGDDMGVPRKGRRSVGATRRHCGVLRQHEDWQLALRLSVANERLVLPIASEIHLPEFSAIARKRRTKAGVPDDVPFRTKLEIATARLRAAVEDEVPRGVLLAEAGYGSSTPFRDDVTAIGFGYVVGIKAAAAAWPLRARDLCLPLSLPPTGAPPGFSLETRPISRSPSGRSRRESGPRVLDP